MDSNNNEIKILGKYAIDEVEIRYLEDSEQVGFFAKETGKQVFPTLWDDVFDFGIDGYAAVQKNERWGFINCMGELVVPYRWKEVRESQVSFPDGLCAVLDDNELWGFINANGEVILPCQWKDCRDFRNGECAVKDNRGRWSYIDKKGNFVRASKWKEIGEWTDEDGLCFVQDGKGLWGLIDEKECLKIPCQWKEIEWFVKTDKTDNAICLCWVKNRHDKWGCIDSSGRLIVAYKWSKGHLQFNEGLCAVQGENGLWGAVNNQGVLAVPTEWDDAPYFIDGKASVKKGIRIYFIDTHGKIIKNENTETRKDDYKSIAFIIIGCIICFLFFFFSGSIGYAHYNPLIAQHQWLGWLVAALGGLHAYDLLLPIVLTGGYLWKCLATDDQFADCQPHNHSKRNVNKRVEIDPPLNQGFQTRSFKRLDDNSIGFLTFAFLLVGGFVGALLLPDFFAVLICLVLGIGILFYKEVCGDSDGNTHQRAFGAREGIIAFVLSFFSLRAIYFLLFTFNYYTAKEEKPTVMPVIDADYVFFKDSRTYYLLVNIDDGMPYSLKVSEGTYNNYVSGKTSNVLADIQTGKLGFSFISDFNVQ